MVWLAVDSASTAILLAWRESVTLRDRRLRLLDQADEQIEHGAFHIRPYLEDGGTFRNTELSDSARHIVLSIASQITTNSRRCYETAYNAILDYDGTHDIQYVEGIALPKHPGRIALHAWIEIDGAVAELTWPWHRPDPPAETVYFGIPVDETTLRERMAQRPGTSNPVVVSEEMLDELRAKQLA